MLFFVGWVERRPNPTSKVGFRFTGAQPTKKWLRPESGFFQKTRFLNVFLLLFLQQRLHHRYRN